ncbi:MAG: PPOX class F420-dependent oxidoreductase [SAR202 cluster bacterium]|nr:PPOX class F420-dependent oxidoreductase [SAR202 cluster bacterium]
MPKMTRQEIEAFMAEPHVGHLTTLRPDGQPHVTPVWFLWKDNHVLVMTGADSLKARHIARNPAVALSIAAGQQPYRYVVVEGLASLTWDNLLDTVRDLCIRYNGPERGTASAVELMADRDTVLIIDIAIKRVISRKFERM